MGFDYFYGQQAEMFSFYRVPKVLFTDERFWNISTDAKLLYGILLDRMNLSAKNGWMDEAGRVYIIFTIDEIKGSIGCAEKKAVKLLDELERKCGLIERKRQGLGKPNLIYVKNFVDNSVDNFCFFLLSASLFLFVFLLVFLLCGYCGCFADNRFCLSTIARSRFSSVFCTFYVYFFRICTKYKVIHISRISTYTTATCIKYIL